MQQEANHPTGPDAGNDTRTPAGSSSRPGLAEALDGIQGWQEELYRDLHRHPELSMAETRTRGIVADRLADSGYEVLHVGGGVVGILRNGEGPTVLFRADMDALPVHEETGLDYAATGDVMHACGHDMHVAAALGAAAILATDREAWSGTYLALFQPGEETAAGARSMVDDGLVGRVPTPDVALGQHVLTTPVAGHVGTHVGPTLSTALSVHVTVHGRGSHGSMPHLGIDPVVAGAAIVLRLQAIVARELPPGEFGVVTVGSLQAGSKANIIPGTAELRLNIRAYSEETRDRILAAITRIATAECEASGCPQPPTIETYDAYPLTDNDAAVTQKVTEAFVAHFGDERVDDLGAQTASEDVSRIPDAFGVPYCYWGFGGFTADQESFPNHNPRFAPALQPTLRTGTEAAAVAALAYLGNGSD